MKLSLVVVLSLIVGASKWFTDFEAAREIAVKENKFLLLNFSGSDWCAPCIKMKSEVFESQTFLSLAAEHLILVRADFPRTKKNQLTKDQAKRNEALAERYNPSGKFPLTLLLTANGKIIKEWDGYAFGSQDKFISDLNKLILRQELSN
jgi:thioredoxin-related protein